MNDTEPIKTETPEEQLKRVRNLLKLDPYNTALQHQRNDLLKELGEQEEPIAIYVNTDVDPKLDPNSPDFDLEEYKKFLAGYDWEQYRETIDNAREKISSAIRNYNSVISSIDWKTVTENIANVTAQADKAYRSISEFIQSGGFETLIQSLAKNLAELSPEELAELQAEIDEEELDKAIEENADQLQLPEFTPTGDKPKKKKGRAITALTQKVQADVETLILQGTATNQLTKIKATKRNTEIDPITGTATITRGDFIVTIPHYDTLTGLKTSTHQLLDAITLALTADPRKNPVVQLPLKDYMELRGLTDVKEARKQVKADLDTLFNVEITFTEKRGKGEPKNWAKMRICDAVGEIKNGVIIFSFGRTFHSLLLNYPLMPYQPEILKINPHKNPNSYYLGRKITELKNMNAGRLSEDTIAVQTLLDSTPELPTYSEVMSGNKNLTDRIIRPFERDLDALEDSFSWEYCHSKGEPLTEQELARFDYETFKNCLVKIHWKNYPDQTERLQARQEKIDKAKASRGRKKKPKADK